MFLLILSEVQFASLTISVKMTTVSQAPLLGQASSPFTFFTFSPSLASYHRFKKMHFHISAMLRRHINSS